LRKLKFTSGHQASFKDVIRELEKSPRPTMAEAYVQNITSSTGRGLACWRPEPHYPYGKSERVAVVPGHFGTYTVPDSFRIISHYLKDQGSIRATLDRSQGKDYNPPVLDVRCDEALEQDGTIVVGASSVTEWQPDGR
jgi:hypothetical protein